MVAEPLLTEDVRAVMAGLEARNAADSANGTPQQDRLRAIAPAVGEFLLTLAVAIGARTIVEVGTSGGYSTLWLASAARYTDGRVTTFEIDPRKVALAQSNFESAGVESVVDLRSIDGGAGLAGFQSTADLVFIDSEKDDYERLLDPAIAALRPGGLLVADNLISHASQLYRFRERALSDPRLTGLVVPLGGGELVATRL
jgi:caffeoyl-CoA O-methyltransferase